MRIDLETAQHHLEWDELARRVKLGEDLGFEGVWIFDHFKPLYGDKKGPCMEGWSTLGAMAALTEKVRIGNLVTGVTYRHPSVLAATAATVDNIAHGRLEFGIGAAWHDEEHRELGIDFASNRGRAERLEDAIEIYKRLTTEEDTSYNGKHFSLDKATYNPKPVQDPWPPIWIGASGEQIMLPLVGRQADVWHSFSGGSTFKRKWDILAEAAEKAGRKPDDVRCSTNLSISEDWSEVKDHASQMAELGVSILIVPWPSEGQPRLEEFVSDVMPEVQKL
ncbi:MAG: LLM class flavin-dependent oxidoreductase [Actinomycetota bacterium]